MYVNYVIICISRPAKPTDVNKVIIRNDPNHILYHEGECWSSAGKCKGVQYIQLSNRCFSERTISHEFMHSIGFLHEHQRPDRDLYVYVNESCITKGYEEEFKIHKNLLTFGLRYRAKSIMHYSSNAFSVGNCPTIISKVSIYNYISNFFCQFLLMYQFNFFKGSRSIKRWLGRISWVYRRRCWNDPWNVELPKTKSWRN